jgi:hypothetical protein
MAVSTYSTNMTDLFVGAGDKANATALGGGASGLNDETDYFIQGTGMISKNAFASAKKGMIYNTGSDRASLIGTDGAFVMWTTHTTPNSLALMANGGIDMLVGSSASDYKHWYVGGSDTIEFLGWVFAAVNPSETTSEADTGTPTAVEQYVGVLFDLPSGGPTKGAPNAMDAIRAGRCDLIYELGTSTDPDASFDLAVADKGDVTDRLGLIQLVNGSFFCSGLHQLGSSTNAVNFTDSNKTLFWRDHPGVTAPFNTVEIQNASSVISLTSISWKALGTKSPGTWVTTDNATVTLTSCSFIDWGDFGFDTNTTISSTFLNCGQITHNGATMNNSIVSGYEGTANTSALIYNVAVDPNGEMDGMSFTKGTAATHAIEFGTTSPLSMTLTDIDFTGYNTSNAQNDSAIHVKRTSGTVNITVSGGSGVVSYRTDGAIVNIISGAVTVQATATLKDGTPVENARVYLKAVSMGGTEPFPVDDTVTITRSGTTATVTHTSHGMATNDKIVLEGITDKVEDNFTIHQITVTGTNTYTYTTTNSGSTSYTGTILATFVALSGLTNASGVLSTSRVYSANQDVIGWARKSTSSPYLQEGVLVGTVNSSTGFDRSAVMLADE